MSVKVEVQTKPVRVEIMGARGPRGESAAATARRVLDLPPETSDTDALIALLGQAAGGVVVRCTAVLDGPYWRIAAVPPHQIVDSGAWQWLVFDAPATSGPSTALIVEGINDDPFDPRLLYTQGMTGYVPEGGLIAGGRTVVCYSTPHFELLIPTLLSAPEAAATIVTVREDEATNAWVARPVVSLPNNSGEGLSIRVPLPRDQRPAEGGFTLRVIGINDVDPLQVLDVNETDQLDWRRLETATAVDVTRIPEGGYRLEEIIGDDEAVAPEDGDPIGDWLSRQAAARGAQIGSENQADLDAIKAATGFDGSKLTTVPFADGSLAEGGGGLQFGGAQLLSWPAIYANDDLTLDFVNGYYANGSDRTRALRALPGFSFTRTGNKGEFDGSRVLFQNASVPAILAGIGFYSRQSITNLLAGSAFLATQNVTTTAADHTISFFGTGTVTLSGTYSGTLVGTGANNRVSLTFTPTAGTLTLTVSGTVRLASLILGTLPGPVIITPAGASATVGADTLQVSYSLDDEPFLLMVKVDLKLAGFTTRLLCLNEANSSNNIRFERLATNQLRATPTVGGSAVSVGQIAANTTSTTGVVVLAIRRDAAGKFSEAARHVNGDCVVAAPGSAVSMPPGMVRLDIGNFFGADQPRSPIQAVRCLRGNFTDAQVLALLAAA